jgi:hypothetical protein
MKFVSAAALALIGCLVDFNSANAQGAAMKTTPTTKILAIGTINPGFEQSQAAAHEMLEKLPLGRAHMMSFELIPIGPLNPLRFLQGMQPKP